MLNFQSKIIVTFLAVFAIFLSIVPFLSPFFASWLVENAMDNQAQVLPDKLIESSEKGILFSILLVLGFFSFVTWAIINHFSKPIQEVILALTSHRKDQASPLKKLRAISLNTGGGDAGKLTTSLVSFSDRIQQRISATKKARTEKEELLESLVEGVISEHYHLLEMKKEFIANASHELKTPITIIRGFAETIYEHPDLDPELMHEITEKIVKNCDRMATLVRDLLALADIENIPSSRIQAFDLEELTRHVIQMVLQIFKHAEINIENKICEPLLLEADQDLIEMALTNLISNGVKYSTRPAKVLVTLSRKEETLFIEVIDEGIGIPHQDLPRIFERFYRVDKAHSRKLGGSGLGLSIVETIVKKHLGTISVASELGKGTTFTIQLPSNYVRE